MLNRFEKLLMADSEKPNQKNQKKPFGGGNGPQKPDGEFDWSKIIRTVFSWGAVIIVAVIIMQFMRSGTTTAVEVTYDVYEKFLEAQQIVDVKVVKSDINDYRLEGKLNNKQIVPIKGTDVSVKDFVVTFDQSVIEENIKV